MRRITGQPYLFGASVFAVSTFLLTVYLDRMNRKKKTEFQQVSEQKTPNNIKFKSYRELRNLAGK